MKFVPLASGSKANSYLVAADNTAVLIDFGLSIREGEKRLAAIGVNPAEIAALFITHNHQDHSKNACKLANKYKIPIYANAVTSGYLQKKADLNVEFVIIQDDFQISELSCALFSTWHDMPGSVGISVSDGKTRATVITDTGKFGQEMINYAEMSEVLVLEANYDSNMLRQGHYPGFIKKRIDSEFGHLSNDDALRFIDRCKLEKLETIYLGHISENNNSKMLVEKLFTDKLICDRQLDVNVEVAYQHRVSNPYYSNESEALRA